MGNYYETFNPPFFLTNWTSYRPLTVNNKAFERNDQSIVENLRQRLDQIHSANIGIQCNTVEASCLHQVITLSGTVKDNAQKNFIEKVADQILGSRKIINNLEVMRAGATKEDSLIKPEKHYNSSNFTLPNQLPASNVHRTDK